MRGTRTAGKGVSAMPEVKTKEELKAVAMEVLDALRPRQLQIWQVKETLRFAIEIVEQERLK